MIYLIAPWIPIVAPIVSGLLQNVISGKNTRKARLYDSPINQVKRLNEAGLPLSAASNISPGGGVTATSSPGGESVQGNIESSVRTQTQQKQQDLIAQEIRSAKAKADTDEAEAKNKLNPTGQFEPTNMGTGMAQTLAKEGEALKAAQIINKWMPIEKYQGILRTSKEINKISADIANSLAQNNILINEGKIKGIIANYQERMSMNELKNLIARTTGINHDIKLKKIAINVEWNTMLNKIEIAKIAALQANQNLEASKLAMLISNLSIPSRRAYYEIRREMDDATMRKPNIANVLLYLGMFQPENSNYNMSNIGSGVHTGLSRWWDMTN